MGRKRVEERGIVLAMYQGLPRESLPLGAGGNPSLVLLAKD